MGHGVIPIFRGWAKFLDLMGGLRRYRENPGEAVDKDWRKSAHFTWLGGSLGRLPHELP